MSGDGLNGVAAVIELEPLAGDYTVRTAGVRNPGWMEGETRALPWRRADQPAARGPSDPGAQGSDDKVGGTAVFVNHLRISSPEDVHDAIQQLADARKGPLDAARRGVRSWDDTRQAAGERDAWADLMDQRAQRGEAIPTAERQLAMRELLCTAKPLQKSGTCSRSLSPSLRADLAPDAGMIQGRKAMRKPRLEVREAQTGGRQDDG